MEEQFYVVWPFLLLLLWRWGGRRAAIAGVVVVVIAGCCWRLTAAAAGAGQLRLTFGGDTHGPDALALGGLLALLAGEERVVSRLSGGVARWRAGAAGLAMLGILAVIAPAIPLALQFTLAAVAAALVVIGAPALRVLSAPPAVAVGRVSYGVYLWHQPILFALIRPLHLRFAPEFGLTLGLSLLAATMSFLLVERPLRRRMLAHASRTPAPRTGLRVGFAEP